ncbi:hypothetical protein I3249_03840 [Psychrobacter sp. Ps1]|nr:hypothetical protein [Psychrobacter sp. Ps1]
MLQDAPETSYRNPFLVNAMVNLNMMDTIGSGIKKMYQIQYKRFFPLPDYDLSDNRVRVKFTGKVLDQEYAKQLASVDNLTLHDIIALDKVQKGQAITENEVDTLRKKSLIEGRKNSYIIAADVAKHTEQQAEYMHYQSLIIEYLKTFERGRLADFDKMLANKLPQVLDDKQRKNKVRNLLQKMRRDGLVVSEGWSWHLPNS